MSSHSWTPLWTYLRTCRLPSADGVCRPSGALAECSVAWRWPASDPPAVDEGAEVLFGDAQLPAEPVHAQSALLDPAADGFGGNVEAMSDVGDREKARA